MDTNGTINKVTLIGTLGDDVKLHFFEGGSCIGRFPLATDESFVNQSTGETVTLTEWHQIVVRNKVAESAEKYLSKGDKVYVEGRIRTSHWTDNKGISRNSIEIHARELVFLKTKKSETTANN